MSLEQKIEELTEVLREQVELQKAIVEGQKKAVTLMQSGAGGEAAAPKRGRPPKAAEPAAAAPAPEPEPQPAVAETQPESVTDEPVLTQDDLKKVAVEWRNSLPDDKKSVADAFFKELASEFGVEKFMGPTGLNDSADIKRAIFYIDRKRAGKKVDFSADYDFDGSPEQEVAAPAASDDPFA